MLTRTLPESMAFQALHLEVDRFSFYTSFLTDRIAILTEQFEYCYIEKCRKKQSNQPVVNMYLKLLVKNVSRGVAELKCGKTCVCE